MNIRILIKWMALAGMLAMAGLAQAYTITTIDGSAADWPLLATPSTINLGQIGRDSSNRGVYSWNDPVGDEVGTNGNGDLVAFHITADATYLYLLVDFSNITITGDSAGSPHAQIAIDRNQVSGSGGSAMCMLAGVSTVTYARFEYVVDLTTTDGVRIYNSGCTAQSTTGASAVTSATTDLIEARIPWARIGGVPANRLRFTVITGISKSNGQFQDTLDAITSYAHPSQGARDTGTYEFNDGDVDYYFDVWFVDYNLGNRDYDPAPPVTITEIYPHTTLANEWVEILNRSGVDLSLSGWEIGDEETLGSTEGMHTFPASAQIPAGHVHTIANSGSGYFAANGKYPNYEINAAVTLVPDMGDDSLWGSGNMDLGSPDEVLLLDPSYTIVDRVSFTAPAAGSSLSRTYSYRDTDAAADFGTLVTPTPGVVAANCKDGNGTNNLPTGTPCNNGDLCLTQTCSAGTCTGSTTRTCPSDGNECTSDACDAAYLGCGYPPLADTVDCNDTSPTDCYQAECNGSGGCDQSGGFESAGTACPDADTNDCKTAACNGTGTCNQSYGNEPNGDPCTDNTATDCKAACCQVGVCEQNFAGCDEASGSVCTDTTPGNCGQPRCNATGTCNQTALPQPNTYECNAAGDPNEPCDVPEFCDGATTACPADGVASGTVCHIAVGLCDLDELCDGVLKTCPFDEVAASGTVCHPNGGPCDIEEACDGILTDCPTDEVIASGTRCHTATTVCDVDDYCDGVAKACVDDKQSTSFECRESFGICDPAEFCDGINNGCPADAKSSSVCGPSANPCDLAELCDGVNNDCPVDEFASPGAPCDDLDPCIENTTCDSFGNCTGGIRVCIDAGILPDAAEPDTLIPDAGAIDTSLPDLGPEDTYGTDLARPDASAPDWSLPDTARPDTAGTDLVGVDSALTDAGVAEDGPAVLDASTGADAVISGPPTAPPIESAPVCGCAAPGAGGSPAALLFTLLALAFARRRRS